jgi:hypothetical protein
VLVSIPRRSRSGMKPFACYRSRRIRDRSGAPSWNGLARRLRHDQLNALAIGAAISNPLAALHAITICQSTIKPIFHQGAA